MTCDSSAKMPCPVIKVIRTNRTVQRVSLVIGLHIVTSIIYPLLFILIAEKIHKSITDENGKGSGLESVE
jgi:hypothetical protein